MGEIISNTPYDDVYRTMYVMCDELVLPLLNEVFGEHYSGKEKIIRRGNEHFDLQQEGAEEKHITDSFLEVVGETRKKYHCECESTPDGSILIRMFQYGSQIALEDAELRGDELFVEFPNAAVLYLRSTASTPQRMKICIRTSSGEEVIQPIETLKMSDYSVDTIFEKKLYFLIPFYIFNVENHLKEYDEIPEKLKGLERSYQDIYDRLEHLSETGEMLAVTKGTIRELSNKVVQNIAERYENVRKGMGEVMGGKVLSLDVIKSFDEGRQEGRQEELYSLVQDGIVSVEKAAARLGISVTRMKEDMERSGYIVL